MEHRTVRFSVAAVIAYVLLEFMIWPAHAQINDEINYQGTLANSAGTRLTGDYDLTFKLFDARTNGTAAWQESHVDVAVTDGSFSVQLGSVTPLGALDFGKRFWLEIVVDGEKLVPRLPLGSVPSSLSARPADGTVEVDCGSGGTTDDIQRAIDNAPFGKVLVDLKGSTCAGTVLIERDHVTLKNGTLDADVAKFGVVEVNGARNVSIENMTLTGGIAGTSYNGNGLLVSGAYVHVRNSTISGNGRAGVAVGDGGNLHLWGSSVESNGREGITIVENSNVDLLDGTVVKGNHGHGVGVYQNSHLDCQQWSIVLANTAHGVYVEASSSVTLNDGCTIDSTSGPPSFNDVGRGALYVLDGSSGHILGNTTLRSHDPAWDSSTLLVYRGSVVKIQGAGNRIINTATVPADPLDEVVFAMDVEMNSTVRASPSDSPLQILGSVYSHNLSTVDLRSFELVGHATAGSLDANVRMRSRNSANVDTPDLSKVKSTGDFNAHLVSYHRFTLAAEVEIDGRIDCSKGGGGLTRNHTNFKDPDDGYYNC